MKIHKLHIKNLNSLNITRTIDFDDSPLKDTGIFAIMGPTGSGKSTLLDAITLALYGQIPRSDRKVINRTAIEEFGFILTDMAMDCYATVDYEVQGKMYRSKWSISRNKKGGLREYNMELAQLPGEQSIVERKSEVPGKNEELIGLKYDQFVKSILLAQGDFTRFLKARPSERGEILETITGTDIYRKIGRMAFEKKRTEGEKLQRLTERTGDIQLMTDDERAEKQNSLKGLQEKERQLQNTLEHTRRMKQIKEQLQELNKSIEKDEQALAANREKLEAMQTGISRLKQHDKLVWLQGDFVALRQAGEQQQSLQLRIKQEEKAVAEKQEKHRLLEKEKQAAQQKHEETINDAEAQKPRWAKVKELDKEIDRKQNLSREKQKQKNDVAKEQEQLAEGRKAREKDLHDAGKKIDEREQWLEDHRILTDLPGELSLINDKQQQFTRKTQEAEQGLERLAKTDIYKELHVAKSWEKRKEVAENQHKILQERMQALRSSGREGQDDEETWQERLQQQTKALSDAENLISIQETLLNKQKEYRKTTQERQKELEKRQKEEARLPRYANELEVIAKQLEELQARLEREQLEAKYEQDRLKLEDGQACFLCGATHHPYVKHNKQAAPGQTRNAIREKQKERETLEKERNTLQTRVENLKVTINNLDERIQKISDETDEQKERFARACRKWKWNLQPDDQDALLEHKSNLQQEDARIRETLKKLAEIRRLDEVQKRLNELLEKTRDITVLEQELEGYWQKYAHYLKNAKPGADKVAFLRKRNEQYNKEAERLQTLRQQHDNLNTQIENLIAREKENAEKLQARKQELKAIQDELEGIQKERKELFGEKDPDKEQEKMQNMLQEEERSITRHENRMTELVTAVNAAKENIKNFHEEEKQVNARLKEKTEKLQQAATEYGYQGIEEAEAAILTQEEAAQLREQWNKLEDYRKALEQRLKELKERRSDLLEQDDKDITLTKVKEQLETAEKELNETNRQQGSIRQSLTHDDEQRSQHAALQEQLKQQNKEYEKWRDLSDHIGDSSGKRFATFAQELTMKQLLRFANDHLQHFSERYRLGKLQGQADHNKDDLVIVDTYQGDMERSINTLSGGESFLVSLALALGLSDLAGGTSKLSSLFIDEGFGSLDQQSLDTALDTLEKLQHETDRTIGIISHVQALKDRINTRIELSRTTSGYSSLEVVTV